MGDSVSFFIVRVCGISAFSSDGTDLSFCPLEGDNFESKLSPCGFSLNPDCANLLCTLKSRPLSRVCLVAWGFSVAFS